MFVLMNETLAAPGKFYMARKIYDVEDAIALEWVDKKLATETTTPPPHIQQMLARLDEGAGKPTLFLPFVGEFGHEIMSHVRLVHFSRASSKVVCCRPGNEVLYPTADEFVTDWVDPVRDCDRGGTMRGHALPWPDIRAKYADHVIAAGGSGLTREQEIFTIRPGEKIPFIPIKRGLKVDVVLGVRHRNFCVWKNWTHWQYVADALTRAGLTFAVIGDRSTSYDLVGQQLHSGDMDTAAAVELLQGCKVFIGSDTGSAHLASTVGARMVVFRESMHGERDYLPRMQAINPGRVVVVPKGWDQPAYVVSCALETMYAAHGVTGVDLASGTSQTVVTKVRKRKSRKSEASA